MSVLTGGCACGAVRFTATGAPRFAFICQCRDCQQMTGSDHAAQFAHAAEAFALEGRPAHWDRQSAAGFTVRKFFCATCGAPVYGTTSRAPDIVMVLAEALDDPAAITPTAIVYGEERITWDHASVPARSEGEA